MTRVCIFGAGAIGGMLAARLGTAGIKVNVVARGAHLHAIRQRGLTLVHDQQTHVTHPHATDDTAALGPQDYLILAIKAYALAPALPQLRPLIGPQTTLVAAINGIPWWYTYALPGPYADRRIHSIDADGSLWRALPPAQTLGCVVYPAATLRAPGVIEHTYGDRLSLGEPDGTSSARATAFAALLMQAGFKAPVRARIRDDLWMKLWGNLALNPVSALTAAPLNDMLNNPNTCDVVRTMMQEAQTVGEHMGARFVLSLSKRLDGARQVGAHRTSMLQDLENGRPLEIEALLGAVVEMAEWAQLPMPVSRAVLALVRQRAASRSTVSATPSPDGPSVETAAPEPG